MSLPQSMKQAGCLALPRIGWKKLSRSRPTTCNHYNRIPATFTGDAAVIFGSRGTRPSCESAKKPQWPRTSDREKGKKVARLPIMSLIAARLSEDSIASGHADITVLSLTGVYLRHRCIDREGHGKNLRVELLAKAQIFRQFLELQWH